MMRLKRTLARGLAALMVISAMLSANMNTFTAYAEEPNGGQNVEAQAEAATEGTGENETGGV